MKMRVETPARCSGPFSECVRRSPDLTLAEFYRGQMRGHAGTWRERHWIAALLGRTPDEIGNTALDLAKHYRDSARLESLKGGAS